VRGVLSAGFFQQAKHCRQSPTQVGVRAALQRFGDGGRVRDRAPSFRRPEREYFDLGAVAQQQCLAQAVAHAGQEVFAGGERIFDFYPSAEDKNA